MHQLCPDAAGARSSDGSLALEPIVGGITNTLFRATYHGRTVLIRIYGDGGMIDRVAELQSFCALAAAGIGPRCFGSFANGRLEEFFEGFRTLAPADLSDADRSAKIARELARSHAIPVEATAAPSLWGQLADWLSSARAATFCEGSAEAAEYASIDISHIEAEIARLRRQVPESASVVFCHNDLLAANILEHPGSGELKLIDFEYGGPNYRAFDIANHFNEWAGGTDDGSSLRPCLRMRAALPRVRAPGTCPMRAGCVRARLLAHACRAVTRASRVRAHGICFTIE